MEEINIPFNKPYLTGKEAHYIYQAVYSGKISGNGKFTKLCHEFFQSRYGFEKCLLTSSCTDALEMASILIDVRPGDEIIMPSYTFVSTANAFVLRGAKIVFVDSRSDHPGIDENKIEERITKKTKAIVPVHYAGVACDMDKIMAIANKYGLYVIEDAAQSIDSYYKTRSLGGIGHLATFSFHETKNVISGEGGMLVINDSSLFERSEIIWEKGTNRAAFWRGEIDKYGWVDVGSSFLPSEIIAAFLFAQLENLEEIQAKRINLWRQYYDRLCHLLRNSDISLPVIPNYASNNAHMFYIVLNSANQRDLVINHLRKSGILSVFHYLSLHKSEYIRKSNYVINELPNCDRYSDCLLRLPFYYELNSSDVEKITGALKGICKQ